MADGNGQAGIGLARRSQEIGATGVKEYAFGKSLFTSVLYNQEDYNPDLRGQRLMETIEEMRLSDGEIASALSRIEMPLIAAEWKIVPVEDDPDGEEKAAFCEKWIMGRNRRDPFAMTWRDFLRHALLMLPFGFSAFEKVWGVDDGTPQRHVFAKLAPRLPKTVWEFRFKRARLDSMLQRAWINGRLKEAEIPAEKLMLFVFSREGDNYWGRSILRACYKPWYNKSTFEVLDGIAKERNGVGMTVVTIPVNANDSEKEAAEKVATEGRGHERQGFVIYDTMKIESQYPTGTSPDIVASIKYHDSQISQVLQSEWMHLGASESGSRATAESKIDVMLLGLQGIANMVEDVVNTQAIVELIDRNWGAQKMYPRMECEDLTKMSGERLASVLAPLMQQAVGAITPDVTLEGHIREGLKLPPIPSEIKRAREEEEKIKAERSLSMAKNPVVVAPGDQVQNVNGPGAVPDKVQAPQKENAAAEVPKAQPKILADIPVELFREPFPHERCCAFSEMKAYLQNEPKRVWQAVILPYRRKMIDVMSRSAASASDKDLASGFIRTPFANRLASDLKAPFMKVYMTGRRAVVDELTRQKAGQSVSHPIRFQEDDEDEDEYFDVQPKSGQRDWITKLALAFVTGMIASLRAEAVRSAMASRQADMGEADQALAISDDLMAMSEAVQLSKLTGQLTRAFTNGRNDQGQAMHDQWDKAYYSAIMDDGTEECARHGGTCALLDGKEHEPDDPAYQTPNPGCVWVDNCRCETIYVRTKEAA